jgi:hypothetical protein
MEQYSDVIVRPRHLRGLFCMRGARVLAAHLGFDWTEFVKNGVTADKLIATGDGMAIKLAQVAIEEKENGRQC